MSQAFILPVDQVGSSKENLLEIYQHTSVVSSLGGSLVYNYGGEDSNGYWTNRMTVLNVAVSGKKIGSKLKSLEWEKPKFTSFPPKKDSHVVLLSESGKQKKLYIFGGNDNQNYSVTNNAMYSLDLESLTWKIEMKHEESPLRPTGRLLPAFTQIKNNLYMYGGKISSLVIGKSETSISSSTVDDFWMFSADTCSWKRLSTKVGTQQLPKLSGASLCASAKGDSLFLYGGANGREYSNELYKYSVKNDTWECVTKTKGDTPKVGRERHSCCLLPKTNEMLISGGWLFGGASAEEILIY